jgi:hypothetical protein
MIQRRNEPHLEKIFRKVGKRGSFSMPTNLDTDKDWYIAYIDGQLIIGEHRDLPLYKKYKLTIMIKKNSKYITLGKRLRKSIKAFGLTEGATIKIEELREGNEIKYRLTLEDYECDLCKKVIHAKEEYYSIVGNKESFLTEAGEIEVHKSEWFFLSCKTCTQALNISDINDFHDLFRNSFLKIIKDKYNNHNKKLRTIK